MGHDQVVTPFQNRCLSFLLYSILFSCPLSMNCKQQASFFSLLCLSDWNRVSEMGVWCSSNRTTNCWPQALSQCHWRLSLAFGQSQDRPGKMLAFPPFFLHLPFQPSAGTLLWHGWFKFEISDSGEKMHCFFSKTVHEAAYFLLLYGCESRTLWGQGDLSTKHSVKIIKHLKRFTSTLLTCHFSLLVSVTWQL